MSNQNVGGASSLGSAIRQLVASEVQKTVRELLNEEMVNSGTQEAAMFDVEINGVNHQVISDESPALNITINPTDEVRISKSQSAAAGR